MATETIPRSLSHQQLQERGAEIAALVAEAGGHGTTYTMGQMRGIVAGKWPGLSEHDASAILDIGRGLDPFES